jgi:hypothetical protein
LDEEQVENPQNPLQGSGYISWRQLGQKGLTTKFFIAPHPQYARLNIGARPADELSKWLTVILSADF